MSDDVAGSGLRLFPGGRRISFDCAGICVVAAAANDPPFPTEAIAFEEDTWTVLSAETEPVVSRDHPLRVMTRALDAKPREPGTVVIQPGQPMRFLAIIHDLDNEPSWTKEWIERALSDLLEAIVGAGYRSLKLPMLGAVHGDFPPHEFVELLRRALPRVLGPSPAPPALRRIWLVRGNQTDNQLLQVLEQRQN